MRDPIKNRDASYQLDNLLNAYDSLASIAARIQDTYVKAQLKNLLRVTGSLPVDTFMDVIDTIRQDLLNYDESGYDKNGFDREGKPKEPTLSSLSREEINSVIDG